MEYIQTLWTRDTKQPDLLSIAAGWLSPEYHWMSWALSCLQLNKLFGRVALVTDTNGKYILSTLFKLPYSHISTLLDDAMNSCPADAWALAKIHAYNSQSEPFLHFDSDFYLWHLPGRDILDAQVVAQNLEKDLPFYKTMFEHIEHHFKQIPEICFPKQNGHRDIYACNAGIFGGNNLSFIRHYCRFAIDFVKGNTDAFAFDKAADLNFVFEQYFLYCLAEQEHVPITFLSGIVQDDPLYSHYIHFVNKPFIPFIHPVGGYKRYTEICDHVAAQLRMLYPDDYNRIIDILNKENKLSFIRTFYTSNGFQQKDNRFFSSMEKVYMRTIAALDYLITNAPVGISRVLKQEKYRLVEKTGILCIDELKKLSLPNHKKNLLFQLYKIETKKFKLYESVFDRHKNQEALYLHEVREYQLLQTTFAGDTNEIETLVVKKSPHLALITVSQNWTCKIPERTGEMILDKFEKHQPQKAKTALVPHMTRRDIDEYYLEPIDILLFDLCRHKTTIGHLIKNMETYFSQDDLKTGYDRFRHLIVNTVKRLLYLKIMVVSRSTA